MTSKNLKDLSNEELLKNEKALKTVTSILAGAISFLLVINIVLLFKNGFSAMTVIPIALLPIVIINFNSLKGMKSERISRGL